VFVLTKTYEVLWLNEEEWSLNHLREEDAGLTYASRNTIYMRLLPGATEANYQEVLLHEITHAVWAETMLTHLDISKQDDEEESVISLQSPGLLFVLHHNPEVVKYLTSNPSVRRDHG
jgi:hypothetical protein